MLDYRSPAFPFGAPDLSQLNMGNMYGGAPEMAFMNGMAPAMSNPGYTTAVGSFDQVAPAPQQQAFIPAEPGAVAPYNPATGQSGFVDTFQQDAYGRFTTSPDYLFRFNEGQRALDSSAAARGMLLSGNQLRALTELGQNLASQEYGNYMNRLYGVAGLAPTGGQNLAGQGAAQSFNQMFNAAGSLGTNMGNIAGANATAQSNIWGSALGNVDWGAIGSGISGMFGGGTPTASSGGTWNLGQNMPPVPGLG